MNKRRRFKAERTRRIRTLRQRWHYLWSQRWWTEGGGRSWLGIRDHAERELRSMGMDVYPPSNESRKVYEEGEWR